MNLALKIIVCRIVFILGIGVGARFFFAPVPTAAEFGITLEGPLTTRCAATSAASSSASPS